MIRRDFVRLGGAGFAGLVAEASLPSELRAATDWRNLKITAVEAHRLQTNSLFVLVRTNEGVTGLGEVSPMNTRVLASILQHSLAPIAVGKNPLDVGRIWDEMLHATYKLGTMGAQPEAMAGIDIALWDILGKTAGLPIWQLLGGKRKDRVRLYASIGNGAQNTVADQVKKAVDAASQGYTAVKMRMEWSSRAADVNPAKDWELVSTVRKELGDKLDLYYDANNGLSVSTAIRLGRRFQDELNVIHYEEPVAQHDYAGYAEICAALDMPVAAGEHEYTLWQFRDLIERAKVDIVQPDLVKCAGLTEAVRIAHLAQAHGKILVPHQTQQTIGHTINVHYLAAFDHSSRAQEYSWVPERAAKLWTLFKQDLSPKGGYATVPDGPGLGLELDEAAMKAQLAAS
ncbi:MAG TPA: mandelate racemase/muconate lactonizing enzyme family protein [Vicinamibacteria bacterium]|jgi:L-alanine-DL-glutamate epimerase-like enolase superfamily enzyme